MIHGRVDHPLQYKLDEEIAFHAEKIEFGFAKNKKNAALLRKQQTCCVFGLIKSDVTPIVGFDVIITK